MTTTEHSADLALRHTRTRIAEQLRNAEASGLPIVAVSAAHPELTLEDAYAIQAINIERRLRFGERIVGRKIGLTSEAMQRQLGVDQPDVGAITDRMVLADGDAIPLDRMIAGRIEAEFAFRIGRTLPPGEPGLAELVEAISGVALSAEIIDSRIKDWKIGLIDTVADNASSAFIAHGEWLPASEELLESLPGTVIRLEIDGVQAAEGPGSAVLGDPLRALLWLARTLGQSGVGLVEGDVVLAGAVHASIDLTAGSVYTIAAEGFGPVRLTT